MISTEEIFSHVVWDFVNGAGGVICMGAITSMATSLSKEPSSSMISKSIAATAGIFWATNSLLATTATKVGVTAVGLFSSSFASITGFRELEKKRIAVAGGALAGALTMTGVSLMGSPAIGAFLGLFTANKASTFLIQLQDNDILDEKEPLELPV